MPKKNYIKGQIVGICKYLTESPPEKNGRRRAIFQCDCGKEFEARISHVSSGATISCGCKSSIHKIGDLKRKHGFSNKEKRNASGYSAWKGMIRRCYNPNEKCFHNYGGRGIKVCDRWKNSFEAFMQDMGPKPSLKHSLDRYPNTDGDYEPGNCRWATLKEQARNTRKTIKLTHEGITKSLPEWAELKGMKYSKLQSRYYKKWPIERMLIP